ncbi:hypothetical protein ACX6BK_19640, partial [Acinetobacter baumannii]
DLPTTGEISFVVESGALVSSSSSYRPETRFVYKFALYTTNFTEPLSYQGSAFLKLPKFP